MKLATIKTTAEEALKAAGFKPDQYLWVPGPNRLVVTVGGCLYVLRMSGGMSRVKLERILGKIDGWRDAIEAQAKGYKWGTA